MNKKILVVDDIPELRSITTNVLINAGYEVVEARNGAETIEMVIQELPDLVLLDIILPDINGVEVCRQIKSMRLNSPPYVVLFTAELITSDDLAVGLEGGADGYMSRPISNRELLARIESFYRLKSTEDALRESEQKLIELNEQKSKVFSIIAHDLKAPFNSILGFADILNSELENLDDDELEMSAFNIYSSALEANNLLVNLLEWSKLNWRSSYFRAQNFNLEEMISEVTITYQSIFDSKEIDVEVDVDEDIEVHGDRDMLHTIVRNLFTNAIKFSHVQGIIKIQAEIVNGEVVLKIIDKGIGIRESDKEFLLKADSFHTTIGTHDEKGSGLGLNICLELISKNRGRIWFESKENEGTTFFISMPLALSVKQENDKPEKSLNESDTVLNGKTILVAEDIDHVFKYIEFILKKSDVQLIWAKNGLEALNIIKEGKQIDLILMDLSMPEMNGLDATAEIRKLNIEIPIIAQTAFGLNDEHQKSLRAGCNDYIQKPLNYKDLMALISKYLK
jgi:two-component system, sensor histidine kinase and response regulator